MKRGTRTALDQSAEATDERRASRVSELAPKIVTRSSRRKTVRDRKLRARRIRVTELALGELTAHTTHSSLGRFQGRVDDLSLHGMQIITKSNRETGLVLSGDRLQGLCLVAGDKVLYSGDALVRRVAEEADQWVLGVEVKDRGIDLDTLYRLDRRVSIAEKLHVVIQEHEGVSREFKAWVADLLDFFEATKQCLDKEEASFGQSDRWTREEANRDSIAKVAPIISARPNRASVELADFVADFDILAHQVCLS